MSELPKWYPMGNRYTKVYQYTKYSEYTDFCKNKRKIMKKNKIIFWISTGIVAAMMLMSGAMYLTHNPKITEGLSTLGYPPYMLYILGIAKLLAAVGLLQPLYPKLREWAYAGLAFTFIGATWSHLATATPFVGPVVFLVMLMVSWYFNSKMTPVRANS